VLALREQDGGLIAADESDDVGERRLGSVDENDAATIGDDLLPCRNVCVGEEALLILDGEVFLEVVRRLRNNILLVHGSVRGIELGLKVVVPTIRQSMLQQELINVTTALIIMIIIIITT
jgi:hypothetical protein